LDTSHIPVSYTNGSTTSEDPVLRELIATETSGVFITDIILATIMTTIRAIYPWDIIITKEGDKFIFDKQPNSTLEMMTANENATDGLPDEEEREDSINGQRELAREALRVNKAFRLKSTLPDLHPDSLETHPDDVPTESEQVCAHIGYRYRKWTLPGSPPVPVFVRTELDTYVKAANEYAMVRAVNEYDGRITGSYRLKLENNRGQLLSTEAKNNACKLSKWALQAKFAGAAAVKLGFVSREDSRSNAKHVILGVINCQISTFTSLLNLNYQNW
jgi:translation initiation factor 3 subunit D